LFFGAFYFFGDSDFLKLLAFRLFFVDTDKLLGLALTSFILSHELGLGYAGFNEYHSFKMILIVHSFAFFFKHKNIFRTLKAESIYSNWI